MNEKLKAMLAGLTAVHFCGEMAGHQIMDAPAPVEPTQLDREYSDYYVYKGDDVTLCPRCENQDIHSGQRVCGDCRYELLYC